VRVVHFHGAINFDAAADYGSAPVSDQITFWLQLVVYLMVAIFSVMQGYDAYADGDGRIAAASATV